MSSHLAPSPTRFVLIILAVSLIGVVAFVSTLSHSRSAEAAAIPFQSPDQSSIRQINLHAKDLVVDPNTQKIYASVPSVAGNNGNSIASFDPATGLIGPSIFIGSEPAKMAISNNGQFIYVALVGAAAVRRFRRGNADGRSANLAWQRFLQRPVFSA